MADEGAVAADAPRRPLRVLHYLHCMCAGGVEKWLVELMRVTLDTLQMDFAFAGSANMCAEQARQMGASVIHCPLTVHPRRFGRAFGAILAARGPYDVVHSHMNFESGLVLREARKHNVPVRIAHVHGPPEMPAVSPNGLLVRGKEQVKDLLLKHWLQKYPTHYCSVSEAAAAAVLRPSIGSGPPITWLPASLDLEAFEVPLDRLSLRRSLGIPPHARVIGHVGRLCWVKNHTFLLDVAGQVMATRPETRVVLVGEGPLRAEIHQKAQSLRIADRVLFLGVRPDVPALMRGAMDIVLLPSYSEGLPRVVLEAQAAGTSSLVSDAVPREAVVVPRLVQRRPLADGTQAWSTAVIGALEQAPSQDPSEALKALRASPFDIQTNAQIVTKMYLTAKERGGG